jgi:hypothetical protein
MISVENMRDVGDVSFSIFFCVTAEELCEISVDHEGDIGDVASVSYSIMLLFLLYFQYTR